jgi:hypothetical protein
VAWSSWAPEAVAMSPPLTTSLPTVRCDNDLPGDQSVGCIVKDAPPPVIPASLSQRYPEYANHLRNALMSGLQGSPQSGRPLHRETNRTINRWNGDAACPSEWSRFGSPPHVMYLYWQCDEYPFRSTQEGAASLENRDAGGRTFSGCRMEDHLDHLTLGATGPFGWSSCFIEPQQNVDAGRDLGIWYGQNRIINGDAFYVDIP